MIAGRPTAPPPVPAPVRAIAAGRAVDAVWANQLGGVTWQIGEPAELFVKWQPIGAADLGAEVERLVWLAEHTTVPRPVDSGHDARNEWLVTEALPGTTVVADRWKADPEPAVRAIGVGLRHFHDSVPTATCPFDWSVESRLARHGNPDVGPVPPVDRLVVCHGDACAPNTLVDDDGAFVAHVDMGSVGLADRWADLAIASWSLDWNFGEGWGVPFFEAYGVEPDDERIDFYRRLWDAT